MGKRELKVKEIIIRTPIWKTNSIGINVYDLTDDDQVKVSISHVKANGELYHPYSHIIQVGKIKEYPVGYVISNNPLYDIPIADLSKISLETTKIK
jgi:hypothetical protein